MAWPEVVFVGTYPTIVGQLAHAGDFAPHDLEVTFHEPDDAPLVLPPTAVAVVVDQRDLRGRYPGVPSLCHFRLPDRHRHLGKWSISIDGMEPDTEKESLRVGAVHVSDDHEVRQFCIWFLLAAIEHSLKSEEQSLSSEERLRIFWFRREMLSFLSPYEALDDRVAAVRLSIASLRLELVNPVLDREIVRRCLYRIEDQVARFATVDDLGELGEELTALIHVLRAPGRS